MNTFLNDCLRFTGEHPYLALFIYVSAIVLIAIWLKARKASLVQDFEGEGL